MGWRKWEGKINKVRGKMFWKVFFEGGVWGWIDVLFKKILF